MSWRISVTRSCRPAERSSRMRRTWVSIERSRARVSASIPPPPPPPRAPPAPPPSAPAPAPSARAAPGRAPSPRGCAARSCAIRSCPAAMRSSSAVVDVHRLRRGEELGQLDDPRLGLRRARRALLHDLAELVDLLGGLADHRQHVGRGQRLLRVDAGDAELGDRGEPLLELAVEAVLRVAGEELEQADDERPREAEERRAEGGAHAAELALEPVHQRCRSSRRRSAPPSAPASGWCRPPPAPRWRGRRRCREGRGRSGG